MEVCHIEIRDHLTKLWAFKDGKKAPYRNPSSFDQVMGFKRCKHIEIRVHLTKLLAFKDERRPISVNLCKIKINHKSGHIFYYLLSYIF